jgi:hypothetical protein
MIASTFELDAAKPLSVILKPKYSTSLSANVHFVGFSLSPANLKRDNTSTNVFRMSTRILARHQHKLNIVST